MAPKPIIFAMANPDPEITPPDAKAARPDAIVATGRSDYPNQVNNVLASLHLPRRARRTRDADQRRDEDCRRAGACGPCRASRFRKSRGGLWRKAHSFGSDYIIPAPFDPRLMEIVPAAVARRRWTPASAQRRSMTWTPIAPRSGRGSTPTTSVLTLAYEAARANPKRVLFAEGDEETVLRAAIAFRDGGYGIPVLVGRDDVHDKLRELGVDQPESFELHNSRRSPRIAEMVDYLYERMQRRGCLHREAERLVNQDRNVFASLLLELGEGDVMITGITRPYGQTLTEVRRVIDPMEGMTPFGVHVLVGQSHTIFMADTTVTERPTSEQLVDIAVHTAAVARRMGHDPRVAFLSYSTFGNPEGTFLDNIRGAVRLLDGMKVDFDYEGEMAPDVALNPAMQRVYPFSRLSEPANVLIMPGLQSANLSAKLLRELGGDSVIGPMLVGMAKPVQIAPMTATASDLVTLAVLAAGGIAR
jgi:malate dehydrogenase (oxaloacetate-decarboxylating)(NADP+)